MGNREDAKRLLENYLSNGDPSWNFENHDEVGWIVDAIIQAALEAHDAREAAQWQKDGGNEQAQ